MKITALTLAGDGLVLNRLVILVPWQKINSTGVGELHIKATSVAPAANSLNCEIFIFFSLSAFSLFFSFQLFSFQLFCFSPRSHSRSAMKATCALTLRPFRRATSARQASASRDKLMFRRAAPPGNRPFRGVRRADFPSFPLCLAIFYTLITQSRPAVNPFF